MSKKNKIMNDLIKSKLGITLIDDKEKKEKKTFNDWIRKTYENKGKTSSQEEKK